MTAASDVKRYRYSDGFGLVHVDERAIHVYKDSTEFVLATDYDAMLAERDRLAEALRNLQSGIVRYLADPLRKKTCAHAEMFIEVIGEQVVAAISPKPTNHDDLTTALSRSLPMRLKEKE